MCLEAFKSVHDNVCRNGSSQPTPFIDLITIVGMTLYRVYCLAVDNQGNGSDRQGGLI